MSISQRDWNLFEAGALCLPNPPGKEDSNLEQARTYWNQIREESLDPKARSIAKALVYGFGQIYAYSRPLKRWSGGALTAPGEQHYLDYPEVYVSPLDACEQEAGA
jgi:hypothetical protein